MAQNQVVVPAAHSGQVAPASSDAVRRYDSEIRQLVQRTPVTAVKMDAATRKFFEDAKTVTIAMTKHSTLISDKWLQTITSLARSGLTDSGIDNVFLRQFTQEDFLQNVRTLRDVRAVEENLTHSAVPGAERLQRALNITFSNYASLCELDRSPQSNPVEFGRELRQRFEFFTVSLQISSEQMANFVAATNSKNPQ